ncbi:hypothetical protein [Umezakia ovalisporum]|uniref:Uncharacterized protein n=2 Tax=Umezakia ovalisporum TaxID=75695 RepID=A0AA43GVQ6_9CYAN|nr:hypothetical protein [Umezakia ovalisporum]MDH6056747.1 hypothetical protein [Umezakia ovalisporum FSS-43]MDH6062678.1 hypothetical protein [Umezakia ovalisporum FSS-62]MDH6072162.1 hypothetical protein [Umezakia ovalisporum CobakiLakeA]MDH6082031.1 hypothetical protein [Umezakia ovalisporum FSS-44]MDH6095817.1 hypothetical protein [Umezakia ovalisporum CobakiLakeB]
MTDNSIQGNGNWYYADGQWISDEGADLSVADASASGNPPNGYIPDHVATGNSIPEGSAGNPFGGGSPFMAGDGGNVSMTSEDGQHTYNYTRNQDARSLAPDDNNPFGQLIEVLNFDGNSFDSGSALLEEGNNLAGAFPIGSTPTSSTNENLSVPDILESGEADMSNINGNTDNGNSFTADNNLSGAFPIGSTPTSSTNENFLPEAPEGLSVPYSSDDWISDLKDLESGEPGASSSGNTGNGNGNWFYGSDNTADGNGNWYFGVNNTSNGNGNWQLADNNTADGNGNWYFGVNNTSNGNGNWQLGDNNTVNGNANRPSGNNNSILGNANTSNNNGGSLLGNRIEASEDGKAYIGNEDWSFDILDELTSLGSGVSGVGNDVASLLSHPDLIATATSQEGFTNSPFLTNENYQY